jgi:hypothetical protein
VHAWCSVYRTSGIEHTSSSTASAGKYPLMPSLSPYHHSASRFSIDVTNAPCIGIVARYYFLFFRRLACLRSAYMYLGEGQQAAGGVGAGVVRPKHACRL